MKVLAGLPLGRLWRTSLPQAPDPARQVLLMDVDGVLIDLPDFYCSRFPSGPVRALFAGDFLSASTGRSDLLDHLPAFMAQVGREGEAAAFYREWLDYENRPNRAMLGAVRELRAQGWRVYLATNQERHRTAHLLRESGLGELVDGHFASYLVGHRKPDPAYYAAVTAQLCVPAGQILFWDDTGENVAAARWAGWVAYQFTGVEEFRRRMESQGAAEA